MGNEGKFVLDFLAEVDVKIGELTEGDIDLFLALNVKVDQHSLVVNWEKNYRMRFLIVLHDMESEKLRQCIVLHKDLTDRIVANLGINNALKGARVVGLHRVIRCLAVLQAISIFSDKFRDIKIEN
ncbi:hypothetical protein A2335_00870 [Candidatus Peregrinibacteria bacterium RIFOXYB2_FULL_32_7]|nr:MAG: hypothetical protein A2335_00870 [Candidatus Peregrinibacteria bacterium RIFOXYB2_FULL_32_7]